MLSFLFLNFLLVFKCCVKNKLISHFFFVSVTNKHHFVDGPLLYQFRMNFRRRRRLIELLHERSRGIPESHDSPFCLRKQNSDGGNTSFLSGTQWELMQPSLTHTCFTSSVRRYVDNWRCHHIFWEAVNSYNFNYGDVFVSISRQQSSCKGWKWPLSFCCKQWHIYLICLIFCWLRYQNRGTLPLSYAGVHGLER